MKRTTSLILCLVLSISLFAQSRVWPFRCITKRLLPCWRRLKRRARRISSLPIRLPTNIALLPISRLSDTEAMEMVLQGKPFSFVEHNTYFAVQYTGRQPGWNRSRAGWWMNTRSLCLCQRGGFLRQQGLCCRLRNGGGWSFVLPYADKDVMLKVSFVGYKSQIWPASLPCTSVCIPTPSSWRR